MILLKVVLVQGGPAGPDDRTWVFQVSEQDPSGDQGRGRWSTLTFGPDSTAADVSRYLAHLQNAPRRDTAFRMEGS